MLYKPHQAEPISQMLARALGKQPSLYPHCCYRQADLPPGSNIVNICPGCDRRFNAIYPGVSGVTVWEILAGAEDLVLPDYQQAEMTIHDACPTRQKPKVTAAIRKLAEKMNIRIVEPQKTKQHASCCGDSLYGKLAKDKLIARMSERAAEMPSDEVIVYCVSCTKAMHLGGKRPRYIIDLLLGEATEPGECDPDLWHELLKPYISGTVSLKQLF